jgi:hypothetical protein
MTRHLILAAAAFFASTFLVACGDDDDDADGTSTPRTTPTTSGTATAAGSPTGPAVEVVLAELDGSGITGEAVLSEAADLVEVLIAMDDNTFTGGANLHTGTCDDFDETPAFMLGNVASGALQAEIETSMDELQDEDHVITIVGEEGGDPVACGPIEG